MDLLSGLIDENTLKVLSLFLKKPDEFFHINGVSSKTKVPLATTFRIMKNLTKNNIISYKEISKFKVYHLAKNNKTKQLGKLL